MLENPIEQIGIEKLAMSRLIPPPLFITILQLYEDPSSPITRVVGPLSVSSIGKIVKPIIKNYQGREYGGVNIPSTAKSYLDLWRIGVEAAKLEWMEMESGLNQQSRFGAFTDAFLQVLEYEQVDCGGNGTSIESRRDSLKIDLNRLKQMTFGLIEAAYPMTSIEEREFELQNPKLALQRIALGLFKRFSIPVEQSLLLPGGTESRHNKKREEWEKRLRKKHSKQAEAIIR